MPKRNLVLLVLLVLACLVAFGARRAGAQARLYAEVANLVRRNSVESLDDDAVFRAAIGGVFARLDGESRLLHAGDAGRLDLDPFGAGATASGGVGLEVTFAPDEPTLTVTTPLVGSPAWSAGIAAGDRIVSIDGVRTEGMRLKDAVAALRGPTGTVVVVGVAPPVGDAGETRDENGVLAAAREVRLERGALREETVRGDRRRADGSWDWFVEGEDRVALLRVSRFGAETVAEIDRALGEIAAAGIPRGIILDLRGNPGGAVSAAIEVCDRFLDGGVIVSTRRREGDSTPIDERRATTGEALPGVPAAVLVDGLTASAAEVVAACLQDHRRGVVVGSRTYGRGTVQNVIGLSDGRHALRLTTAEYLRPDGRAIHRRREHSDADAWGVSPDAGHEIAPTAGTLEAVRGWRLGRDVIPRHAAVAADSTEGSLASSLPRTVDPVIGRALAAIAGARPAVSGE